jgi:hypothetical protein
MGDHLLTQTIEWSVGDSSNLYWYLIEGEGMPIGGAGTSYDKDSKPTCNWQCQKMLQVVAAKNLCDLCTRLKGNYLTPPVKTRILSIKRYTRPVYKVPGSEDVPNELIEEDMSSCPECMSFMVESPPLIKMDLDMKVIHSAKASAHLSSSSSLGAVGSIVVLTPDYIGMFKNRADGGTATVLFSDNSGYDDSLVDVQPINETVSACGCDVPAALTIVCDIAAFRNAFENFTYHNNLTYPRQSTMFYSSGAWRETLHFTGESIMYPGQESWRCAFQWGCANQVAGDAYDLPVWEFSMMISRKTVVQTTRTRILVAAPTGIWFCDKNFNASISLDLSTGFVAINDHTPDYVTYLDGIGLFANKYWSSRTLTITLGQQMQMTPEFDVTPMLIPVRLPI